MKAEFVLRLFITGRTPRSERAVRNISQICDERLNGNCDLQVVDVYQQPELASEYDLIAAPTLVKLAPPPLRRLVGDMSDRDKVLRGLGVPVLG